MKQQQSHDVFPEGGAGMTPTFGESRGAKPNDAPSVSKRLPSGPLDVQDVASSFGIRITMPFGPSWLRPGRSQINLFFVVCIVGVIIQGGLQYTWRFIAQYPIEFFRIAYSPVKQLRSLPEGPASPRSSPFGGYDIPSIQEITIRDLDPKFIKGSWATPSEASPLNRHDERSSVSEGRTIVEKRSFEREFLSFDPSIRHREKNLPVDRHIPVERLNTRRILSGRSPLNEEDKSLAYIKYNSFFLNKIEEIFENYKMRSRDPWRCQTLRDSQDWLRSSDVQMTGYPLNSSSSGPATALSIDQADKNITESHRIQGIQRQNSYYLQNMKDRYFNALAQQAHILNGISIPSVAGSVSSSVSSSVSPEGNSKQNSILNRIPNTTPAKPWGNVWENPMIVPPRGVTGFAQRNREETNNTKGKPKFSYLRNLFDSCILATPSISLNLYIHGDTVLHTTTPAAKCN